MLDIQDIRDRKDELQKVIDFKNKHINLQDFLQLDEQRRSLQKEIDDLKHEQKTAWKQKDFEKASSLKKIIQDKQEQFTTIKKEFDEIHWSIPNFVDKSVPRGKSEDENEIIKTVGKIPEFDFDVKDHQTLWEDLNMIDKEQASKVSGSRFFYLFGDIASLQYALLHYCFSVLTNQSTLQDIIKKNNLTISDKPFTVVVPPSIVSFDTMDKMWRLHPKEDRYCLEEDNQVLIWSAEHSLWPIQMNQTIQEQALPIRYVAYTSSYRREAWTYGKDTRGILRTHEFHKIEMETFCTAETWIEEQNFIVAIQEHLVASLWLPYQLLNKCTWDVWAMNFRWFDINTYMPWQHAYRETHTSDYMSDYQARRLNIKVERKDWTKEYAHMNDATAYAMWRILIAIIENNQQKDGSIRIPDVLIPFMWGKKIIQKSA